MMIIHQSDAAPTDDADHAERILSRARDILNGTPSPNDHFRPRITLTYAQSLDGCVSAEAGRQTRISNRASQVFAHRLRAIHDAILVGINTVLIDNPRLNVRLADGNDPTPVIVDSRLRTPPNAHVLHHVSAQPIIITTESASQIRAARLKDAGVHVIRVESDKEGRVNLVEAFRCLSDRGVKTVMIEGGARVITNVLAGFFADQLVLTVAPMILGGVQAVESMDELPTNLRPRLKNVIVEPIAGDLVLHGEFERPE